MRVQGSSRACAGCSPSPSGTAAEQQLLLARDRYGIKPLYYQLEQGRVSFASELKALLRQPNFSRQVDPDALHAFLAFNSIPAPLTIFRSARKLPPGHLLTCGAERDDDPPLRPPRARARARPAPGER